MYCDDVKMFISCFRNFENTEIHFKHLLNEVWPMGCLSYFISRRSSSTKTSV